MRRPIIAGNWKMYKTAGQAQAFVAELAPRVAQATAEVVICPPFTACAAAAAACAGTPIAVAAQDVYWEDEGAFTGEVSPLMLKEIGCKYCLVGHSERRQLFGETDATVNKKVKAALRHGLTPIVCFGETWPEREKGSTLAVCQRQVEAGLAGLAAEQVSILVLAYEPVWAIGTGKNATPQDAQAVIAAMRKCLAERFGQATAAAVRIQYGGSVKPENAAELMGEPDIDGALVGGASLKVDSFAAIVNYAGKES